MSSQNEICHCVFYETIYYHYINLFRENLYKGMCIHCYIYIFDLSHHRLYFL